MSSIWNFFKVENDLAEARGQCLSCGKYYQRNSGTTGSMRRHLERKHPLKYQELQSLEQKKTESMVAKASSSGPVKKQLKLMDLQLQPSDAQWDDKHANSIIIDQKILEMICVDNQPFTVVEDMGFLNLMKAAQPKYRVKSEKFYRSRLSELYDSVRLEVQKRLIDGSDFSFTSDIWSEGKLALLSLTVHFLTDCFQRQQFVLSVTPFLESHTAVNIASSLRELIASWDLEKSQVHLLLRDGAANMKLAGEKLDVETSHCAAHKVNLVVKDSLISQSAVKKVIDKSRNIVGHFHHSPTAQQKLREIQEQLGLPLHSLEQDIEIRWSSTVIMLRRLNEQEAAIVLYNTHYRSIDVLSSNEWELSKKIVALLEIFELFTLEVSKETASISCVLPLVKMTQDHLQNLEADVSGVNTMRETLASSLKTRFAEELQSSSHLVATIMDPRFKLDFFDSPEVIDKAKKAALAALGNAELEMSTSQSGARHQVQKTAPTGLNPKQANLSFSTLFARSDGRSHIVLQETANSAECDFQNYLLEPRTAFDSDPLNYWKMRQCTSGALKKVVRKFLGAPPGSVPSERTFSRVGNIYQPRRRCLKGENVDRILFICNNLPLINFKYRANSK